VPENQLQPYIDEVVDEINFLTAPATENSMGALRARLGRSKPFDIRYIEIGNEDFVPHAETTYGYRWADFRKALSKRFPSITFIATTLRGISSPPALDDHYYSTPEFFIQNFRQYENVSRPTPKVLVGEFAVVKNADAQNKDSKIAVRIPYPSVTGAVAESVYRIGFERNSDIVIGGAYAPVLQNVHSTQWRPNLILFDASMTVKSTSHLAQQIFGQNLGNLLLNSTASNGTIAHENVRKGGEGDGKLGNLYFVATKDTNTNSLIVKFANADANDITVNAQIQGSSTSSTGAAYILSAGPGVDPATAYNTLENPNAVTIKNASVSVSSGMWSVTVPSWGVVVVTIPL
jgi:alpha-N-arabinofuranosidase